MMDKKEAYTQFDVANLFSTGANMVMMAHDLQGLKLAIKAVLDCLDKHELRFTNISSNDQ